MKVMHACMSLVYSIATKPKTSKIRWKGDEGVVHACMLAMSVQTTSLPSKVGSQSIGSRWLVNI